MSNVSIISNNPFYLRKKIVNCEDLLPSAFVVRLVKILLTPKVLPAVVVVVVVVADVVDGDIKDI